MRENPQRWRTTRTPVTLPLCLPTGRRSINIMAIATGFQRRAKPSVADPQRLPSSRLSSCGPVPRLLRKPDPAPKTRTTRSWGLANEVDLKSAIDALYRRRAGQLLERRPALHTALRRPVWRASRRSTAPMGMATGRGTGAADPDHAAGLVGPHPRRPVAWLHREADHRRGEHRRRRFVPGLSWSPRRCCLRPWACAAAARTSTAAREFTGDHEA